jgi:hypothetical protein
VQVPVQVSSSSQEAVAILQTSPEGSNVSAGQSGDEPVNMNSEFNVKSNKKRVVPVQVSSKSQEPVASLHTNPEGSSVSTGQSGDVPVTINSE